MKKFSVWSILTLLIVALGAQSVFAVRSQRELQALNEALHRRLVNPLIYKATLYSMPDETSRAASMNRGREANTSSLSQAFQSASPGKPVGNTYYEYQTNSTMKRQIQTGKTLAGDTFVVNFAWMKANDIVAAQSGNGRGYGFRAWNAKTGVGSFTTASPVHIQDPPENYRAGYVVTAVTSDGRAIVGGHEVLGTAAPHLFWDLGAGQAFFPGSSTIPDAVQGSGTTPTWISHIWPSIAWQIVGTDTITHVIGSTSYNQAGGDPSALKYFRKDGLDETGTWTFGLNLDTVYLTGYDIAASRTSGKVSICWVAQRPEGAIDTLSGNNSQFVQWDNDLYCKSSTNAGVTWAARKNVTKNVDGVDGYRPGGDISVLITTGGQTVVAFATRFWPHDALTGGQAGLFRGRLHFWNDSWTSPNDKPRTAATADWDQTKCNGGAFNLTIAKVNLAECNNKLYTVFVMFNDIPHGISDDCSARADSTNGDEPTGSANGELYLTVSDNGGITWDTARDITNSRSAHCDSATGTGGPCFADQYPTVSPYGSNYVGAFSDAPQIVPQGGVADGNYIDIQYIQDPDPGGAIRNAPTEGTWKNATVAWMRVACVLPNPNPVLSLSLQSIDFPAWGKPGLPHDSTIVCENTGNATLTYTVTKYETSPTNGWLTIGGFAASITSGFTNLDTAVLHLNTGGILNPAVKQVATGGVVFTGNFTTSPDTIKIRFTVADTVVPPKQDTIFVRVGGTPKLALEVSTAGNEGSQGDGKVNMDYAASGYGGCDTTEDVYLYDGSSVVGWVSGGDTIMNWSVFGDGWLADTTALRPYAGLPDTAKWYYRHRTDCANFEYFRTGRFVTRDTTVALEKQWFAPKTAAGDSLFIIQCLRVWTLNGAAKSGVTLGEIVDWDIPADSPAQNSSAVGTSQDIWQRGVDVNDTAAAFNGCLADSTHFGGMRYLYYYKNSGKQDSLAYGAYTAENDSFLHGQDGLAPGETYRNFSNPGFAVSDSVEDLHTGMVYKFNFTIPANDTVRIYTVYSTVYNGTQATLQGHFAMGKSWFNAKNIPSIPRDSCTGGSCCLTRGDVRHNGGITVSDLTFLVAYLFTGGAAPACAIEADVRGNGGVTVSDLTYLVAFLFTGGSAPPACT